MTLLQGTVIAAKVNELLVGDVARIGGSVEQLIDYQRSNLRIHDINLIDGGFGRLAIKESLTSMRNLAKAIKRRLVQEINHWRRGQAVPVDRKTIVQDIHLASQRLELKKRFSAAISSNVIEHSSNPILFLLNAAAITKNEGYQYHAIPHYQYSFDKYRQVTSLSHIMDDFTMGVRLDDDSHIAEYSQKVVGKVDYMNEFHQSYPIEYPFIHQHVFDEKNGFALFNTIFQEVWVDVLKTDKHSDVIILAKNIIRKDFLRQHERVLEKYGFSVADFN